MKKNKVMINVTAALITFLVTLGINFFVTPYITNRVGAEAYGFVSLAINFTSYASIITLAINSMASRFVSVSLFKKNEKDANEYFNSVLAANIIIILILLIPSILCITFLDSIIIIPSNLIIIVKILFSVIFLNFFISLINTSFSVSTFASNHMELYMLKTMESNLLKIFVMILLFYILGANIVIVGIGYILATIYQLIFNVYYMRKYLPMIEINKIYINLKRIKEVILSGIWNTLTKIGQILTDGLDLLISNLFLGPLAMGQLSIAKTMSSSEAILESYLSSTFQPNITYYYAKSDPKIIDEIKFSMRIVSFFANILLIGIIVFGLSFYKLWIPNQNGELIYILTIITLVGNLVSSSINPLFSIYTITNKLKVNSLVTVGLGIYNCIIVFIILKLNIVSNGLYVIAGVSVFNALIKNLTFTPMYSAYCLGVKKTTFYIPILQTLLNSFIMFITFSFINKIIVINSWISLLGVAFICGIIGLCISFVIMFNREEKEKLINIILKKLRIKKNG